jgi:N6-adenosine-specific RNA methylase IME4/ParB-like chromosome segregation protein Spo0J
MREKHPLQAPRGAVSGWSERRLYAPSQLRAHADAALVPQLAGPQLEALVADVGRRGVQVELDVTPDGMVLDGRARLQAALTLGLDQVPTRIVAPEDQREYILLAALRRRQLRRSQAAAVAIELDVHVQAAADAELRRLANLKNSKLDVATLPPRQGRTRDQIASAHGVSARIVQDARSVREADPELFARIKRGEISAPAAFRQVKQRRLRADIGHAPPLPGERFTLIYADPPWQLGNPNSEFAPENHYPTMPLEEIKALPLPAADDAVLYLWAVSSLLPQALEVVAAWGFEFKTTMVWVKNGIGPGIWARNRHELLLVARKGNQPPPDPELRPDSVIEAARRKHSQKPDQVYELLERAYPEASKLELFARAGRPGWTSWGNQAHRDSG